MSWQALLTLAAMGLATYATRVLGYLLLGERVPGSRMRAVMQSAPGCVLVSVLAPNCVTTHPADLLGLALTAAAATRLPVLPTVLLGAAGTALLRHVLP